MIRLILTVALILLLLPFAAQAESSRPLKSYDWSVNASPNLATKPPPVAAVREFMNKDSNFNFDVCSFRFADLRHDGKNLSLLVSLLDGGHGGCGGVSIVDRTAKGFHLYDGEGNLYGIDDVNQIVRDINGDGKLELVFDNAFTGYQGANHCFATWPVIYAWNGTEYANVSAQPRFRRFYEQETKKLQGDESDDCDKATIAKIQRFLGAPPNTGLSDAIQWANSSNHFEREFAIDVLSDIGTPEAKKYLRTITKDKKLGGEAEFEFAHRHFGKPPPEPDSLTSDNTTSDQDAASDDWEQSARLAEPWHLMAPPMKDSKVDTKADGVHWAFVDGFDSKEQCEFAIAAMRHGWPVGEPPNYLEGKCIAATAASMRSPGND